MQPLENQIILKIESQCIDWVFCGNDFLDIGTIELTNKALHQFNKAGTLIHIFDGIYYKPKFSKLLDKPRILGWIGKRVLQWWCMARRNCLEW